MRWLDFLANDSSSCGSPRGVRELAYWYEKIVSTDDAAVLAALGAVVTSPHDTSYSW